MDSIVENDDVDNDDALGRRGENEGDQEKKEAVDAAKCCCFEKTLPAVLLLEEAVDLAAEI